MGMMDFVKRIQQWGEEQNKTLKTKNQANLAELGADRIDPEIQKILDDFAIGGMMKIDPRLSAAFIEKLRNLTPDTILRLFHGYVPSKTPPLSSGGNYAQVLPRGDFRVSPLEEVSRNVGSGSTGLMHTFDIPASRILPSRESAALMADPETLTYFKNSFNRQLSAALAQQGEPQGMLTAGYYKLFK